MAILRRKTLDNNDLSKVESAVLSVFTTKTPLKQIKMAAFGGLCFECYDLLSSAMNSVFSLESVLKSVIKNFSRKNWRSKTLLKLNFKLLLWSLYRLQSLLFKR